MATPVQYFSSSRTRWTAAALLLFVPTCASQPEGFSFSLSNIPTIQKVVPTKYVFIMGPWGPCSKSCGTGTKTRTLKCAEEGFTSREVEPHVCLETNRVYERMASRAPPIHNPCNTQGCIDWRWRGMTSWGPCTVSCGDGVRGRSPKCIGTPLGQPPPPTYSPTLSPNAPTPVPLLHGSLDAQQNAKLLNDSLIYFPEGRSPMGGDIAGGYTRGTYVTFPPGWGMGELSRRNNSWFNETWKYMPGAPYELHKERFEVIQDSDVKMLNGLFEPDKNVEHPEYRDIFTNKYGINPEVIRETFTPQIPFAFQLFITAPANHPPTLPPTRMIMPPPTPLPTGVYHEIELFDVATQEIYCGPIVVLEKCNLGACARESGRDGNYVWVIGEWGQCSKSCGSGVQSRLLRCDIHEYGVAYPATDLSCTTNLKSSPPRTRECTSDCAKYEFMVGAWSGCSHTCGTATRSRTRTCMEKRGQFERVRVDREHCFSLPREEDTKKCSLQKCPTYAWNNAEWGPCSVSCGNGVMRRVAQIFCREIGGDHEVDSTQCTGPKPLAEQECRMPLCVLHNYRVSPWSACDGDCETGQVHRDVWCEETDIAVPGRGPRSPTRVGSRLCSPILLDGSTKVPEPTRFQACRQMPFCGLVSQHPTSLPTRFAFSWIATLWTPCSSTCGPGLMKRDVLCLTTSGEAVSSEFCLGEMPETSIPCYTACPSPCEVSLWGLWSACSAIFGHGATTRTRKFLSGPRSEPQTCKPVALIEQSTCCVRNCSDHQAHTPKHLSLAQLTDSTTRFNTSNQTRLRSFVSPRSILKRNLELDADAKRRAPTSQSEEEPAGDIGPAIGAAMASFFIACALATIFVSVRLLRRRKSIVPIHSGNSTLQFGAQSFLPIRQNPMQSRLQKELQKLQPVANPYQLERFCSQHYPTTSIGEEK